MRRALAAIVVSALVLTIAATAGATPRPEGPVPPAGDAGVAAPTTGAEVAVPLDDVRKVATGYYNSCAVLTSGEVRCWGYNGYGTVGTGSTSPLRHDIAQTVLNEAGDGPLQDVSDVVVGDYHACALLTSGQVRCWGINDDGELGDGNLGTDSALPVVVRNPGDTGPLQNVTRISAESDGVCALVSSGQVRCWGEDTYGQLGNGTPLAASDLPVAVKGVGTAPALNNVVALGAGYDNNCAVLANGQARCWGYRGDGGALGDNRIDANSPRPVVVRNPANTGPLQNVTQVSIGGYHGCARLTNGQAVCWGSNSDGELGNGTTNDRARPVTVQASAGIPLTGVRAVFAGQDHTCALLTNGGVRCWGDDNYAQNGDGTIVSPTFRKRPTPVRNVAGTGNLTGVSQLSSKSYHSCVRLTNGQARCWGYDNQGALGNGPADTNQPLPQVVLA